MRDAIRADKDSSSMCNCGSCLELFNLFFVRLWFVSCNSQEAISDSAPFLSFIFITLHFDSEHRSVHASKNVGCSLRRKCDFVGDTSRLLQDRSRLHTDCVSSQLLNELHDLILNGSFFFHYHFATYKITKKIAIIRMKMIHQKYHLHHEVIAFEISSGVCFVVM
jgi:hypothetical protein